MSKPHRVLINMDKCKVFTDPRISDDTIFVWVNLIKGLQPDNCSELSQLDVPFSKKKLDIALKALRKIKAIRITTKEHFYMCNPDFVMYDKNKREEYLSAFSQSTISTKRYPKSECFDVS